MDLEAVVDYELWGIKAQPPKGWGGTPVWKKNPWTLVGSNSVLGRKAALGVTYNSYDPPQSYRTRNDLCSKSLSHVSDVPSEVVGGETVHQMSQKISQPIPLRYENSELFPSPSERVVHWLNAAQMKALRNSQSSSPRFHVVKTKVIV